MAAALVALAAGASIAGAQGGNGLYEPFPQERSVDRAQQYVEELLGRPISAQRLDRGAFLRAGVERPAIRPANARAGAAGRGLEALDWWTIALIAGLVLAIAGIGVRRRAGAKATLPVAAGALIVVAVLGGCGEGDDQKAQAKVSPDFVGVVAEDVFAGNASYRDRELDRIRASGAGLIRQTFDWSQIERRPNEWSFGAYDDYVEAVARHRLDLLPILFNPPSFESSAPKRGAKHGTYPPRNPSEMARFAQALVKRYGPQGTFWVEHPDVPKRPIRNWQVWNEPNLPAYWPSGPNPKAYTRLLRKVGTAIKRADRGAHVVTAGLPQSASSGMRFAPYVTGMYKAKARGAFDTLALHPYARDVAATMAAVREARRIMQRNGDRKAKIWVTEIGWASDGPASSFTVGPAGQASRVSGAITSMAAESKRLGVSGLVYYSWRDGKPYDGRSDFWGLHTGLLRNGGKAKPAYAAFERAAKRAQR